LASDRIAILTVDAALEGLIDYRQADFQDTVFMRRWRIVLDGLQRRRQREILLADFNYYGHAISAKLNDECFKDFSEKLKLFHTQYVGSLQPWVKGETVRQKNEQFKDARQAYIRKFGWDPKDPKFKEWEAEQIRKFEASLAVTVESDDVKIARRAREIEAKKKEKRQGRRKKRR